MHHYIYIREYDLHAWALVMPLISGKWKSFVFLETHANSNRSSDCAPSNSPDARHTPRPDPRVTRHGWRI